MKQLDNNTVNSYEFFIDFSNVDEVTEYVNKSNGYNISLEFERKKDNTHLVTVWGTEYEVLSFTQESYNNKYDSEDLEYHQT